MLGPNQNSTYVLKKMTIFTYLENGQKMAEKGV